MISIKKFVKNVIYTFFSNGISLFISMLSMLFLPKILNVEGYGFWQLYVLYTGYLGICHLGLCDGAYLKYGGKKITDIDKNMFKQEFYILSVYMIVLSVIGCFIIANFFSGIDEKKEILFLVVLAAVLYIPKTYMLMVAQACEEFKYYSNVTILERIVFGILVIILLVFKIRNFKYYVIADIIGRSITLIYSLKEYNFILKEFVRITKEGFVECKKDIKSGFPILVAGIASNLLVGIIRFFIEDKWSITEFSKFSLALSILNIFLSFVNMIGLVIFPVLKRTSAEMMKKLFAWFDEMALVILLFILSTGAIVSKFIGVWLPNYVDSVESFCILLPSCVLECKMALVCNSYFKSLNEQKKLLGVNLVTLVFSVILSWITVYGIGKITLVPYVILIVLAIRVVISEVVLRKELKIKNNKNSLEIAAIIIGYILLYKLLGVSVISIVAFIIGGMSVIRRKDTFQEIFELCRSHK